MLPMLPGHSGFKSQKGVTRILSGMNSLEQVEDNTETFLHFEPVTDREQEVIAQVTKIIEKNTPIPCTGCSYCTHGCPKDIAIPQYFALFDNASRMTGNFSSQNMYYKNTSSKHGKASDCIGCGQCEKACPQHLPIRGILRTWQKNLKRRHPSPHQKIERCWFWQAMPEMSF